MAQIFEEYTRRKERQHLLDYDDLLLYWQALTAAPGVGKVVAGRFEHILVDEYQDTNAIQSQILSGMCKKHDNIVAVGDDAQSIYAFRAATIRNILDFPDQFPGTTVVKLEQNYRSTQTILSASNAVMEAAKERYTKELWSERTSEQKPVLMYCEDESEQTVAVCRQIICHLEEGISLMRQAVLFRASHHSAELEVELTRRNIPFHKFGGLKFIETAHVKDMLAFLRILENPFDQISWFRVLQLMDGIGPQTARRIMKDLGAEREDNLREARRGRPRPREEGSAAGATPLSGRIKSTPTEPAAAREQFSALREALAGCSAVRTKTKPGAPDESDPTPTGQPTLAEQIEIIAGFYQPVFKRIYENAVVRLRDLEQLEHIAAKYRSRSRFITDLTLDPPSSTSDLAGKPLLDDDYLTLSTIHSAKGCEWTVVHILHAADGMIPSDMATGDEAGVDEERRLFYVAMTRAKDFLYVYFPLRYYHRRFALGDGHGYAQLTRFIPSGCRTLFEARTAGVAQQETSSDNGEAIDLRERTSRLWNG